MTTLAPALRRAYAVHGVGVELRADDPAVLEAMDLRLRGFAAAAAPAPGAGPALRFEFVSGPPPRLPRAGGRPVYDTPHGSLHYFPEHDLLTGELGGVALRCRPGSGGALITAPEFRSRALYFATHPVTTVALMEMMERRGRFSLHAGCLADADGNGVLLCGTSGAGKSTLTLALARAGLGFLGDDTVFLERSGPDPAQRGGIRVLAFPDALGLGPFAAGRFPELAHFAVGPLADGFSKRLHRYEQLFGREPLRACVPRAIVFPQVTPKLPSAITPLARGEALLRLVPDVLVTQPESTQSHVTAIAALLAQADCYTVRSGHDLERAADLIHEALAQNL